MEEESLADRRSKPQPAGQRWALGRPSRDAGFRKAGAFILAECGGEGNAKRNNTRSQIIGVVAIPYCFAMPTIPRMARLGRVMQG